MEYPFCFKNSASLTIDSAAPPNAKLGRKNIILILLLCCNIIFKLKNHRIIKIGLIISDKSDIRDYQIKIFHSLKKNKRFNVKLFYIDNHKQNIEALKKIFYFRKKKFQ